MILAISRFFLDSRFNSTEGVGGVLLELIDGLLRQIEARLKDPDAGLWELRGAQQVHGFTLLAHWAGAARAVTIGKEVNNPELVIRGERVKEEASKLLEGECWNEEKGAYTQACGKSNLDASMLLALQFGYLKGNDPRAIRFVRAVQKELAIDGGPLLLRYDVEDDFGKQEAAFTVCSFWLVEALAIIGEEDEARELFHYLLSCANNLMIFSEVGGVLSRFNVY